MAGNTAYQARWNRSARHAFGHCKQHGRECVALAFSCSNQLGKIEMHSIIYLVGLVVVVLAILSFIGLA